MRRIPAWTIDWPVLFNLVVFTPRLMRTSCVHSPSISPLESSRKSRPIVFDVSPGPKPTPIERDVDVQHFFSLVTPFVLSFHPREHLSSTSNVFILINMGSVSSCLWWFSPPLKSPSLLSSGLSFIRLQPLPLRQQMLLCPLALFSLLQQNLISPHLDRRTTSPLVNEYFFEGQAFSLGRKFFREISTPLS